MLKQLPEIEMPKGLEQEVEKKINDFFDDLIFNFLDEVLNSNVLENSNNLIVNALLFGRLKYDNKGLFYSKGKISSNLAKQLEAIGGKWSKSAKGYRVQGKKLPMDILQAIARVNIHNKEKINRIKTYLDGLEETKDYATNNLSFDIEIRHIGQNLDTQLKRSLKGIAVPADLTDYQRNEIAKNYTKNLDFYIQKWTGSEIIKLREKLQPIILDGYRSEALEEMIQKEQNVSKKKAKFLARQETRLLVAEYRKSRFKEYGINRYIWRTILDGRERPLHRQLNGQIFSWDNPPIIDEHTGERGNPSEAYNCRCRAIPVIDSDFFK